MIFFSIKHFIISLSLVFFTTSVFPQSLGDDTVNNESKNIIKFNPLAIIFSPPIFTSEYRVILEHSVNNKSSFFAGASFLSRNPILWALELDLPATGYRIQGGYKFYYKGNAPKGSYIGPFVSFANVFVNQDRFTNSDGNYLHNLSFFNLDFIYGHQFVFKNNLTFDIATGLGYKKNNYSGTQNKISNPFENILSSSAYYAFTNIKLVCNLNLGYKF